MKSIQPSRWARPAPILGMLLLLGGPLLAQQYSLRSVVIAGGGSTSSGGSYRITGTLGQGVAGGPLSGGLYAAMTGFWATPQAVQAGDGPTLAIEVGVLGVTTISWTAPTGAYVLQETSTLGDNVWIDSPTFSTTPVNIPTGAAAKFYRLRRR